MPSKTTPKRKAASAKFSLPTSINPVQFWKRNWLTKSLILLVVLIFSLLSVSYGISYWYLDKHRDEPLQLGVTFVPRYARFLGVDPQQTMQAAIDELGVKRFRLVSYWDDIERQKGTYDFSELDWQIAMAERENVQVNLAVGLRQPRWPECHMPSWAKDQPMEAWYPELEKFMQATVERYKASPAIVSYQVENEFFMTVFGDCPDFTRERLVKEYENVKKWDPTRPVIVTRSNNWGGVPLNAPTPDLFGVAVYKRVFDYSVTNRYFEYPYPPWFYGLLAGAGEIVSGKPMIIHELQMEPWLPEGYEMNRIADVPEQNNSMNADRLEKRFHYAYDTGIRTIDTWGMEWWYWRKMVANDPSLWNVAQKEFTKANNGEY